MPQSILRDIFQALPPESQQRVVSQFSAYKPQGLDMWKNFFSSLSKTYRDPELGESVFPVLPKLRYEEAGKILMGLLGQDPTMGMMNPLMFAGLKATRFATASDAKDVLTPEGKNFFIKEVQNKFRETYPVANKIYDEIAILRGKPALESDILKYVRDNYGNEGYDLFIQEFRKLKKQMPNLNFHDKWAMTLENVVNRYEKIGGKAIK